jgi:hypothetical protein
VLPDLRPITTEESGAFYCVAGVLPGLETAGGSKRVPGEVVEGARGVKWWKGMQWWEGMEYSQQ